MIASIISLSFKFRMFLRFPLRVSDNIIDMVASKRGIVLYRESGEIIFSIEGIK